LIRRLKVYGVTLSQWKILLQLWRREGRSQVELQEQLGLERATITGLVQRMTLQGWVQCSADPHDRRVQRVFLTERGRALESITTSLVEEVNNRALEGFSADEREFFTRLLVRALCNVEG
jgi:DNA-binding MarR family transcriptional regulator